MGNQKGQDFGSAPTTAQAAAETAGGLRAVRQRATLKAVCFGLLLSVPAIVIVSYAELVVKEIQIAICQFNPAALGLLLVVVLINRILSAFLKRSFLSPPEVLIVYTMTVLSVMIASRGLMEKLLPALVAVNYFANIQNRWKEAFFADTPRWLVPFDPTGPETQTVSKLFYEGTQGPIPWQEWATPLLSWSIVVAAVWSVFLAIAAIWRRQWADHEKLNFPLTQPPLQLIDPSNWSAVVTNRLAWWGFALSASVFFLNGLHVLHPAIPQVRVGWVLNDYFPERPLNAMYYTPLYTSYAAVGFAYFLPTQLLFSLWFFFWLTRLEDIFFSAIGYDHLLIGMPLYPTRLYIGYQVMGAYLVLVFIFWRAAYPFLKEAIRSVRRRGQTGDEDELMPYSWSFLLATVGFLMAVLWGRAAGLNWWVSVTEFALYLGVVVMVMARSVAEGGLMMTEASFRPIDVFRLFAPKHLLGRRNLTVLAYTDAVFTRDLRGLLITPLLDSLKMCEKVGLRRRSLLLPVGISLVVSFLVAATYQLYIPYRYSGITLYHYVYQGNPRWSFEDHTPAILGRDDPPGFRRPAFGVGVLLTLLMWFARSRFWWFPFHPLAYALSGSWTLIVFWFPLFAAWVIKSLLLRYFGVTVFHRAAPFFIGLIFGEFSMAVLWAVHSAIRRKPGPFFPWP
ncbi:MAG: hypothetical protein NZ959_06410 [Armatimonadetes bacterium]|nr:hypothetical protein [Armatimonadota bacterium]MDW8122025.1 DUF6785 family protein [Armatimonadota bacterium]